jgi:hypothetical protein
MKLNVFDKRNTEVYTTESAMEGIAVTHCGCSKVEYQRTTVDEKSESGHAEGSAMSRIIFKCEHYIALFEIEEIALFEIEGSDVMFAFNDDIVYMSQSTLKKCANNARFSFVLWRREETPQLTVSSSSPSPWSE